MPEPRPTRADQPNDGVARDLALVAVFVGIVAALGVVPALYPFGASVPITAQTLGVILAGAILGPRRGALSLLVFLALVAAGLPLLAGGRGGLAVFASPSVGFLVGFPVAAFVCGWLSRLRPTYDVRWGVLANVVGGVLALYPLGILGMMAVGRMAVDEAFTAMWLFVPGDLIKAVVAAVIAAGVHRGYPRLLESERADDRQVTPV